MDLQTKGASANVDPGFKQLLANMEWASEADFDLAFVFIPKGGGDPGMIYFGNLGDLNVAPFIKHSGDEGVGDSVADSGTNKETLIFANLDGIDKGYLVALDYGAVTGGGTPARFEGSNLHMALKDDMGNEYDVMPEPGDVANVAVVATIDCTGITPKVTNDSKYGLLKSFENVAQFIAIAEG
jgi:hypothetical protein